MTFEEIFILVLGVLCLTSIIISLIAMMGNPHRKSTFKEICSQITSLVFSLCILFSLYGLMKYNRLGVYCYLVILLVVILMTIFFYKTARSNYATDSVLILTIILGVIFACSSLFVNNDGKNIFEFENNMSFSDNSPIEIEAEFETVSDSEFLIEAEEPVDNFEDSIEADKLTNIESTVEMETF